MESDNMCSSQDSFPKENKAKRSSSQPDMTWYNFLPLPPPLIPKALAEYEPPKFGMGFPFLSIERFPLHEGNYPFAPPTGIKDHYKPPEGSLRSIFEK